MGCAALWLGLWAAGLGANVPGGGTGTGANVTVTNNGGTVVLANGITSITIDTANGNITNFSYNGVNLLAGGHGGGYFYIDGSGGPTLAAPTYTLTVNPANNGGAQAEVELQTLGSPMDCTLYYDMLRGQQGVYDTLILTHQSTYAAYPGAELRTNMYVGSIFDFICIDPYRFRQMASNNDTYISPGGVGSPVEVFDFTSGIYNGTTGCKYSYSDPLGSLNVYGWASSTTPYGVWQTFPSHEYLDGGPMHRELTAHLGNTLLDMFGGGHYGFGLTQGTPAGTFSSKTFGPAFIYADKYAGTATNVTAYAQTLWADAKAQAAAEQSAWPYTWFNPQPVATGTGTASAYPQASARGTVSGTFAINDPYKLGASPAGMWIGLAPDAGGVDFQQQYFTYQFWVQTGAGGVFTIPNVVPGTYNLWAFGPGDAGTFEQANVTVAAGQTLNLGTVTWTPTRLGPTVFDIGVPDRTAEEFNNGAHNLVPYSGVLPAYAGGVPYDTTTDWSAFLAYATQYPTGISYTVGTSNDATDWSYTQPTVQNASGAWVGTTSKIFFNMAQAPAAGNQARLYIGFAAVNGAACIVTINGTVQTASVTGSTDGVNAATIGNSANGFTPANKTFDTEVRLGTNGAWGDAYLTFPATDLKAGMNEIDIGMRPTGAAGNGNYFEYDYVRLECQGYLVSPTPSPSAMATASVSATRTVSPTSSPSATATPSASATRTASPTPSPSASATRTASPTPSPSASATRTASPTPSPSATATYSPTLSVTQTPSPMASPPFTASATDSPSLTASSSPSSTDTCTGTPSATSSMSPSGSATASSSPSGTATATAGPSFTPSGSATPSFTPTETATDTAGLTRTGTPTTSVTASFTPSKTPSPGTTATGSATPGIVLAALSPDSGPVGLTVTVTGSGFLLGTTITFGGVEAQVLSGSTTTSLTVVVPPGGGQVPVVVTNPDGQTAGGPGGPTFTYTSAKATATPVGGGPLVITRAVAVPNPNPSVVAIDLEGSADVVRGTLLSVAEVAVDQITWGPQAGGWSRLPLPASFNTLPNGIYYLRLQALRGAAVSAPIVVKLARLR